MNGETLSAALGGVPEDMLAEAMEPSVRRHGFSWLRLAVCIALIVGLFFGMDPTQPEIVTAPGILAVKVYAKEENGQGYITMELIEGVAAARKQENECVIDEKPMDPIGISVYLSIETEDFPVEEILYEVKVERGIYFDYSSGEYIKNLHREFVCANPTFTSWHCMFSEDPDPNARTNPEYDHVYTDIIIYCEEHIIGYAVMRYDRLYNEFGGTTNYDPYLIASVLFPKQNGEYQSVTKEYVTEHIENVKLNDVVE